MSHPSVAIWINMEGVPRIPMQAAELMVAIAPAEYMKPIKSFIARKYGEDPDAYHDAIEEFDDLREAACRVGGDVNGCLMLKKYFGQCQMLGNRFPMKQGEECAVPFCWTEKYGDMTSFITHDDIEFELACVMHNIAALHSHVGALESRNTAESQKAACTHFQCAAGAFAYLRDQMKAEPFCDEFNKTLLSYFHSLMLAQAQECILEKSLVDNRPAVIIAKLAAQAAFFYQNCIKLLEEQTVVIVAGNSRCKIWKNSAQAKKNYYTAMAMLQSGIQADEQKAMGLRLAWYKCAMDRIKSAIKYGEKQSTEFKESLQFTYEVITTKLENAQKENDFIYHDLIPNENDLPVIQGASLVQAVMFDPLDPSISGADIFGKLVPLRVHQANSLYSDEKDKLLRKMTATVDDKDIQLKSFMDSLSLAELQFDSDPAEAPLPDILLERSAIFNADPQSLPKLLDALQRLTSCYQEASKKVQDLTERVTGLQNDAKSVQESVGLPVKCLETIAGALKGLDELKRAINAALLSLEKAADNDKELNRAVAVNSGNFNMLALQLNELKKRLPAPKDKPVDTNEGSELKRMVDKVGEMQQQRQLLVDELRHQLQADDLTKKLIADKESDLSEIFERELSKHDAKIKYIEQNLVAQEKILDILTTANANYAEKRKQFIDTISKREALIISLIAAFDIYQDVLSKTDKGRLFYSQLFATLESIEDEVERAENDWPILKTQIEEGIEESKKVVHVQAPVVTPIASVSGTSDQSSPVPKTKSDRPRLADYMEYYRAKKSGSKVPLPAMPEYKPGAPSSNAVAVATVGTQIQSMPVAAGQNYMQQVVSETHYAGQHISPASSIGQPPLSLPHHNPAVYMPQTAPHPQQMPASNSSQIPVQNTNIGAMPESSVHQSSQAQPHIAYSSGHNPNELQMHPTSMYPYQQMSLAYQHHPQNFNGNQQIQSPVPQGMQHNPQLYQVPSNCRAAQLNQHQMTSQPIQSVAQQPHNNQDNVAHRVVQAPSQQAQHPSALPQYPSQITQQTMPTGPTNRPMSQPLQYHQYQSQPVSVSQPQCVTYASGPVQLTNSPGVQYQSRIAASQSTCGSVHQTPSEATHGSPGQLNQHHPEYPMNPSDLRLVQQTIGTPSAGPRQQLPTYQPLTGVQPSVMCPPVYQAGFPAPTSIYPGAASAVVGNQQQYGSSTTAITTAQTPITYQPPSSYPVPYQQGQCLYSNQQTQQPVHPQTVTPVKQKKYVRPSEIMDASVGGANLPAPLQPTVAATNDKNEPENGAAAVHAMPSSHCHDLQGITITPDQQTNNATNAQPQAVYQGQLDNKSIENPNEIHNPVVPEAIENSSGVELVVSCGVTKGQVDVKPVEEPMQMHANQMKSTPVDVVDQVGVKALQQPGHDSSDVVSEPHSVSPVPAVANLSLAEIVDPAKFTLDLHTTAKPKCKKEEFMTPKKPSVHLYENDPFKDLDPLKNMKREDGN